MLLLLWEYYKSVYTQALSKVCFTPQIQLQFLHEIFILSNKTPVNSKSENLTYVYCL